MAAKENPGERISLLYVEDDLLTLEVQVSVLADKYPGVVFYKAANGKLGLELFRTHTPDIVITDINMSEMSGVQMCNCIRAIKPDTKFIAITGNSRGSSLHRAEGSEFEFDQVIVKPVDFQVLFDVIDQCIGGIRNRN